MPTTFNWIYLGIPRNAAGAIVVLDPTESTAGSENASQLLTAQSGLGPRVFGSAGSPLYNSITSATMINRSGDPAQLDTNTASGSLVDQFSTNIGAGTQTYNFDALVFYTGTVTYVDGTTASNVVLQVVQAESGETFLAPPASTATNAALTAKPIRSIQLDAVSSPNASLLVDRQLGIFDDGVIDGTSGNDSIGPGYVEPGTGGSDQVDGGDGLSSPATGYNDDVIRAGDGNDTVSAGLGNDSVDGGTGDDIINGGAGSDTLVGGIGADTIDGGTEADTINAGDGNDLVNLTGTFGADTITGGLGSDTLSGAALAGASTVVFNGGTGTFANGGSTASFNTIEAVITGAGADSIDASLNTVAGAVFTTGAGSDTITGGSAAETINAGADGDVIDGGAGADTIDAGDGNDLVNLTGTFGADTITGGLGSDTLSGAALAGASTVVFNGGTGTFANGGSTASFNTIEAVTTGAGADSVTITGATAGSFTTGDGADTINAGGSGADTINAGDGNDLVNLTGTFGADTITGGLGSDTLSGAALAGASTVVFNGGTGTFANGGSTASFNTIEAVTTGAGADSIDASLNTVAGAVFTTGAGSDTITGGSAAETINAGADGDVIDGGAGADTIDAGLGDDRIALGASHGNDTITGGEGADTLSGGGLAGAQPATVTFSNGAGTFASSGGTASFNTIETIETGAGADSINAAANTGGASFVTGAGNDSFVGGLGAETVSGGDGDDTLLTGGGNDSVVAGDGNDSVEAGDGADYVDGGSGADTVDGGAGNDTLLGGADNDLLRGGAGDDSLLGGAGNDILLGGDGDDFLDGGPGANTLTGGAGSDTFIVSSGDIITDFSSGNAGSGTDGDPTNNDRLDLSRFYNQANLDIINAQRGANGLQPYRSVLGWLKADQEDDGVLNSLRTANGLPENFTLTIQNGGTAVSAAALTDETTGVVCFGADAMIETVDGPVPAGSLKVGDLVLTRDDGYQPIRWVGHRTLTASDLAANPAFRPIRIRQGALGGGLPDADLIVSPQHRVLARSKIAERMFGTREVLVAAKQLVVTEGIDIAEDLATVTYVHFLFDAHQIVISNGAETESLYTGDEALKSIPAEARAEILGLFPELAEDAVRPAARKMLSGRMARKLAQRHAQNGKKLVA